MPKSKEEKHRLLTKEVADLFNTFGPNDVLYKEDGKGNWYLGDRKLTPAQLSQYADEAKLIGSTQLWGEIVKCLKYLTNRNMYLRGVTPDDYMAGKLTLFTLKNIEKILATAQGLKEPSQE